MGKKGDKVLSEKIGFLQDAEQILSEWRVNCAEKKKENKKNKRKRKRKEKTLTHHLDDQGELWLDLGVTVSSQLKRK